MKLVRLSIEGHYKGLSDLTFDFSAATGQIAALVGLNGSGKSQLLELLVEVFALIERSQRSDFKRRQPFPFKAVLEFEEAPVLPEPIHRYRVALGLDGEILCDQLTSDEWSTIHFQDLPLPDHIVGYSSGLNENLQRAFLKNKLQYFDVMSVRANRRSRRATTDREDHPDIETHYRQRYPGIFPEVDPYGMLVERDTKLPIGVYLDYDCCALVIAALSIIPDVEMNSLVQELPFKHIKKFSLRYDLRNAPIEEDSVKDIQLLIEISGREPIQHCPKSSDVQFERIELDYLSATIEFDFSDPATRARMAEAHYNSPLALFKKLYRLQLLGVNKLPARDKRKLRNDRFFGNVKMPLKLPSTIEVFDIWLDDGVGAIDFDDLSDGETQLIQVLGAARIFRDSRALIIFDEPDTHLNPHWRTHFHQYLSAALIAPEGESRTQVLISAHSSFMISSLRKENVFLFTKEQNRTQMRGALEQTFGSSFDILTKRFFGLYSLISQTAVEEIKDTLNTKDRPTARLWIEENIGDSMEKAYLLRKLQDDATSP